MKETGFVDGSRLTPADTINDGILSDAFGVTSAVYRTPDNDVPFVLPHAARKNQRRGRLANYLRFNSPRVSARTADK
jgi:hypothetical protein